MPHSSSRITSRTCATGHARRAGLDAGRLALAALSLVALGCASPPEGATSTREAGTQTPANWDPPSSAPPHGYGAVRGRVLPEGVEAIVHLRPEGDSARGRTQTFSDPTTGEFAADDLPTSVYHVEVRPLDPVFEARFFSGVVVPWDGVSDLGTVDFRRGAAEPAGDSSDAARPDP